MADILYIVVPCYNEEEVLPETSRRLRAKLEGLMAAGKISERSRVLFVHILPNIIRPLVHFLCLPCAEMIMNISAFSFIGLTLVPPVLRGGSLPQPGAPECPAGGADDGEGAVRHGHLHGRRPPGRH